MCGALAHVCFGPKADISFTSLALARSDGGTVMQARPAIGIGSLLESTRLCQPDLTEQDWFNPAGKSVYR